MVIGDKQVFIPSQRLRGTILALVAVLILSAACPAAFPFFKRGNSKGDPEVKESGKVGIFPETDDVETLKRRSNVLTYKPKHFQELYGAAGNRYIQYGMLTLLSCDYTYGENDGTLNIEVANMPSPTAAAGLFHHHRGVVMKNKGRAIDIGAEGMLDAGRGNRNLYFYRGSQFVKIVYSGKGPVPPLAPIGDVMDAKMPKGRDERPDGFEYIDIEGVNQSTVTLTPGFTFGIPFLPASVTASSPGAGSPASDLFLITRNLDRDAAQLYKDYNAYLRLNAEYIEEYDRGKLKFTKAVDPRQGRVVFTAYKNCLIIAARPDGYEKGEVLIDRVMEKIDQRRSGGGGAAKKDGQPQGKRWNPFRRRSG